MGRPAWQDAVAAAAAAAALPTGGRPRWTVLSGPAGCGKRPFAERVLAALARERRARVVVWSGSEWREADPDDPRRAFDPSRFRFDQSEPDAPFDHMTTIARAASAARVFFYVPRLGTLPPQFQADLVESMSEELPSSGRGQRAEDARDTRGLIVADETLSGDRSEADATLLSRCALARVALARANPSEERPLAPGDLRAEVGARCARCCAEARAGDVRAAVEAMVEDVVVGLARGGAEEPEDRARRIARVAGAIGVVATSTVAVCDPSQLADIYASAVARAAFPR